MRRPLPGWPGWPGCAPAPCEPAPGGEPDEPDELDELDDVEPDEQPKITTAARDAQILTAMRWRSENSDKTRTEVSLIRQGAQMRPCTARISFAAALIVSALGAAPRDARAQAWVGEKGSLDVNFDYNLGISSKVIGEDKLDYPDTGTTSHQLTLGAEYTPIAKLAVGVALPFSLLKYTGPPGSFAHTGHGSYDDGKLHSTLTDLRAGARYQVLEEPIALSPHLAFSIPVADYETIGNTVAGRHLKALHVGLGIGRVIGEATYVHLLYEFSLVEKYDAGGMAELSKHSQNRSDLAFTIGHKLLDQRLDLHVDLNLRETHGGISFNQFEAGELSEAEVEYHDAILDEDIFLVGGGVGYQISNALSVSLSGRYFTFGSNTQNASVIALGIAWSPLPRPE